MAAILAKPNHDLTTTHRPEPGSSAIQRNDAANAGRRACQRFAMHPAHPGFDMRLIRRARITIRRGGCCERTVLPR
jgi:hypothetical protein